MTTLPNIIGITGAAGSGKSTLARSLRTDHYYRIEPFAGPLKRMVVALDIEAKHIYGSPEDKNAPLEALSGKSARYAMQTLGTEWGRKIMGEDFWVNIWVHRIRSLEAAGLSPKFVADDVRFQNEVDAIRSLGGVVVRVTRPGVVVPMSNGSSDHASEQTGGLSVDLELINDGAEYQLRDRLVDRLRARTAVKLVSAA